MKRGIMIINETSGFKRPIGPGDLLLDTSTCTGYTS
jgi:hypothetical protein